MAKVSFDGPNKLIICLNNTTTLNVLEDIYSEWKTWMVIDDNSKYLHALSAVGGDPISDIINLGSTFFLENGWKIRPQEANHTLTVTGNLYTRDGTSPFISTIGTYNVLIDMARSNLVDTVVSGSGVTLQDKVDIIDGVFDKTVESTLSFKHIVQILLSILAGKASGGGTTSITFRDVADSKNRVAATVDSSGNRSAITFDI